MKAKLLLALALLHLPTAARAQPQPQVLAAPQTIQMPPNVKGDGQADDTAAIQSALDVAAKAGGEVNLPAGKYLLRGPLSIPTGVTLSGSWRGPHHGAWQVGSTFLITGGRGEEGGKAAITLQASTSYGASPCCGPSRSGPVWCRIRGRSRASGCTTRSRT